MLLPKNKNNNNNLCLLPSNTVSRSSGMHTPKIIRMLADQIKPNLKEIINLST
jgi:hypothetical protein